MDAGRLVHDRKGMGRSLMEDPQGYHQAEGD